MYYNSLYTCRLDTYIESCTMCKYIWSIKLPHNNWIAYKASRSYGTESSDITNAIMRLRAMVKVE